MGTSVGQGETFDPVSTLSPVLADLALAPCPSELKPKTSYKAGLQPYPLHTAHRLIQLREHQNLIFRAAIQKSRRAKKSHAFCEIESYRTVAKP